MKKIFVVLLAAAVLAALSLPVLAETPVIKNAEYKGGGRVELDFRGDVQYSDVRVDVTDDSGRSVSVTIYELDDDDLKFSSDELQPGQEYNCTVSGVRRGKSGDFESVSVRFRVPNVGEISIREFDFDHGELEIEFAGRVEYENLNVEITDAAGTSYPVMLCDYDRDSIELYVDGLVRGESYNAVVSGVRAQNGTGFTSISGSFVAR